MRQSLQLLQFQAAAHTRRSLADDVRAGAGVLVGSLHKQPAAVSRLCQTEVSLQLLSVQVEGQVAGLVAKNVHGSLIPDDHRPTAPTSTRMAALELAGIE